MNCYHEKIAKILRTDKDTISVFESGLEKATGKIGILKNIVEENEMLISQRLDSLGLGRHVKAHEVYDSLISKVESDDIRLFQIIGLSSLKGYRASQLICDFIKNIRDSEKGFFLKKEKAKQLLIAEPPRNILKALGYRYVEEMLEKEDLLEVFCALRFLEDAEWQNKIFFKQYENLKAEDFEERPIEIKSLDEKWARAAEKFVAKKYHNVSHLKELGVIFIVPIFLGISGETLRLVSLLLHYLYEVKYYSNLFKSFSRNEAAFAGNLISALRGDVTDKFFPAVFIEGQKLKLLVIQRYLAKDDPNDRRLLAPHINPEALHWQRAEHDLVNINKRIPDFHNGLGFWDNLGWVGDFFQTEAGIEILVSFNLVDTIMSLVKRGELIKYLYHHQEALWNKIFIEHFSIEKLEKLSKENIIKGWFEI